MGTTAAQKKLFFNLRKLKSQIDAMEEGDLLPENVTIIANHLKVSETEVIGMNRRLSIPDQSLNAPMHDEGDGEWIDRLVENGDNQEAVLGQKEEFSSRHSLLCGAMGHLSEREQHIITERRLKDQPTTLQHLSSQYGISRERIRQIEVRAFEKLQKSVKNAAINHHLLI
jgi:RNA polymerase sigma-32 factor